MFPQCKAEYTEKRDPNERTLCEILKHYIDPSKVKECVGSSCDIKVFMGTFICSTLGRFVNIQISGHLILHLHFMIFWSISNCFMYRICLYIYYTNISGLLIALFYTLMFSHLLCFVNKGTFYVVK